METTQVNVHSQEYMETMARLMSEALESPEGMRALAVAIAAPIEQEIKRKEISSLLLTRHTLPKGERPIYQKKPKVKAYWISNEGEAQEQELGKEEVEFPTHRIHSAPMVDVSVLKGNKPLELRIHRRHRAVLYASDPAFLDAVLADERGWRPLPLEPMTMLVFRHESLMEFSRESFTFIAQGKL